MTDKDATQADIEARLVKLGQTITTLRSKAEQQQEKYAVPLGKTLDAIESKRGEVGSRLRRIDDIGRQVLDGRRRPTEQPSR